MTRPTDSHARQQRDAALRTLDEAIADHLAQAQRSGELQGAPSYGKPLAEMVGWDETPVEFRLPFKILKNAGVPPPEIALFHRRAALRQALADACSDEARGRLQRELGKLEQALALRLEGMRATGRV
ncbi:DnaJ family domain-containing protein [Ideonella sp. B508-1]|uniref:DnaJ family domain-containing protein n=1 Tax=Ideonella sp. B508-1 TaxID=137716 RepID=UPI00034BAE2C|nr:DnaJ family domain-containing protein [Ideonella sp. B508-1]